jgi:exodeoxyribonuclease V alpha subunit
VLDIVKRQRGSTGIPEYSRLINLGIVPDELSTGAITFHEANSKADIIVTCRDLYAESPNNSRVMAPTKDLVKQINADIQWLINRDAKCMAFTIGSDEFYLPLRVGDEILFTKNNYQKNVQNGLLGKLSSVQQTDEQMGIVTLEDGGEVKIDHSLIDHIELGYSITLHKAQGSQFPRVIIALKKGRIVDRAWFYTAITRAESEVHIVGSREDFEVIVRADSHTNRRKTYLSTLLLKYKNKLIAEEEDYKS